MTITLASSSIAFVVMAAGQSKRLGQPKQSVRYQGESLLVRQIKLCQQLSTNVYCVLGFEADTFATELAGVDVNILINHDWQSGLGNSIASAITQLPKTYQAVMIVLVDQWALTTADLNELVKQWHAQPNKIIACSGVMTEADNDKKLLSPPIIFPQAYFSQLTDLTGEQGAKPVLVNNSENVVDVNIRHVFFDLDTPEQLAELNKR
ncbi:nucleotidyltransferase family protein [Thalassotalea agariperforans]